MQNNQGPKQLGAKQPEILGLHLLPNLLRGEGVIFSVTGMTVLNRPDF